MKTQIGASRIGALLIWAISLLLPSFLFSLKPAHAQPITPTRTINNIELSGRFLEQWSAPGSDRDSLLLSGLPLTPARPEISLIDGKTYTTQWFERARYELHPESQPPYDVQLALLGSFAAEGRGKLDPTTNATVDPADTPFLAVSQPTNLSTTYLWFPETRHTLTDAFLRFWQQYGGLHQFGFPVSEPFVEISPTDGKSYAVQYFERNRMELHPDLPPPYNVQLGLLGSQYHRLTAIPAIDLPIAPPPGITSAKDTYIEGSLQEPDTLFCNEANTVVAQRFCQAITFNDNIIGTDHLGNPFPLAAWYVPTFENGGTYFVGTGDDRHLVTKFKLRPGIKWSDGVELTSNDAIFSYKFIIDDPYTVDTHLQVKLSAVDNPNKYTIIYNWMSLKQARAKLADPKTDQGQFEFLKPFIDLKRPIIDLDYAYIGKVHPQHILSKIPIDNNRYDSLFDSTEGQKPTGYGPYIVKEWRQGDQLTLALNPNYNLTAKPLIAQIVSHFNPDPNAQAIAILTGQRDGIASEGFVVPPDQTDTLRRNGFTVSTVPAAAIEQILLKFDFEPFKDVRVRRALSHAIDRQKIIDAVYRGAGALANGPIPSGIFHSLDNLEFATMFPDLAAIYKLPTYEYDPSTANRLLDEAGWKTPCGDATKCIREKDGVKLSFKYDTSRSTTRQAIQALVYNDLLKIGVEAQIRNYPTSCPFEGCPRFRFYDCQMCQLALVTIPNFDEWVTDNRPRNRDYPGVNWTGYSNPKVDAANPLFKTSVSATERAEQSAIVQSEVMNDAAIIPLLQRPNIEIYSGKMQNRKTPNTQTSTWWNITQWYFTP